MPRRKYQCWVLCRKSCIPKRAPRLPPRRGRRNMLVTNPIPEAYAMDHEVINRAIDEAVAEAKRKGIHGKETTPFLLAKIKDITGGDSLASNIQLVYNNAALAAETAKELCTPRGYPAHSPRKSRSGGYRRPAAPWCRSR